MVGRRTSPAPWTILAAAACTGSRTRRGGIFASSSAWELTVGATTRSLKPTGGAGRNPDGTPHPHALCDANPKSFEYVGPIIDFTLGQFDFGAVHLESCDLGCCWCPRCAGKDGVVGYNARINRKTADYIKQKWPDKIVYVITINWAPAGRQFGDAEMAQVAELGKHVDCVFDQGHTGYQIPEAKATRVHRRPALRLRNFRTPVALSGHAMGSGLLLFALPQAGR